MYIHKVSVKKRYGWRTISLGEFLRSHTIEERRRLIRDPSLVNCVNEFGEVVEIGLASCLLEELEVHLCSTIEDLENFLLVYPDSEQKSFVTQKICSLHRAKPEPKPAPSHQAETQTEKKEPMDPLEPS